MGIYTCSKTIWKWVKGRQHGLVSLLYMYMFKYTLWEIITHLSQDDIDQTEGP